METNESKKKSPILKGVIGGGVILFFLWMAFGGGDLKLGESQMQQVENKVAQDAVAQYEIAKRQGDKIQIYVQAGLVAAAYLQAKDEENYKKWKAIEKEAGKEAGINP